MKRRHHLKGAKEVVLVRFIRPLFDDSGEGQELCIEDGPVADLRVIGELFYEGEGGDVLFIRYICPDLCKVKETLVHEEFLFIRSIMKPFRNGLHIAAVHGKTYLYGFNIGSELYFVIPETIKLFGKGSDHVLG